MKIIEPPDPDREIEEIVRDPEAYVRKTRCRLGLHRWGITTWPIGVRWCERCGTRWPPERHRRGR